MKLRVLSSQLIIQDLITILSIIIKVNLKSNPIKAQITSKPSNQQVNLGLFKMI